MTADEIQALIEDTVPPATEEQIRAFEAEVGHTLPEDYRAFVARCSGGSVDWKCEYATRVSPGGSEYAIPIRTINGVRKGYTYSLYYNRKVIGGRIQPCNGLPHGYRATGGTGVSIGWHEDNQPACPRLTLH